MITISNKVVIIGIKLDNRSLRLSPLHSDIMDKQARLKICTTAPSSLKTGFLPIGGPTPTCTEPSNVSGDTGDHQGAIKWL